VEEENLVVYSQESVFHPPAEMYVNWLDPTIGIQWPLGNDPSAYVISEQDKKAPFLNEALQQWIERNNRSQF
jgi:dTDP-4-dehydrorhamnose 3,5-epimerase-like enzyme